MPPNPGSVPTELIGPHIKEWAERYEGDLYEAYQVLADRTGSDRSLFGKLVNGSLGHNVTFDTADKIFCAMGDPLHYWHGPFGSVYADLVRCADELYPITEEGMVAAAERRRRRNAEKSASYRAANLDAIRARQKRYREKNREKERERSRQNKAAKRAEKAAA